MKLAPLVLFLLALPAVAGTLYRWTDADGRVHFTDHPPPAGARDAVKKTYKSDAVSPELQQARLKNPVTLYVATGCGAACDRARAHLARRGIPFATKDLGTTRGDEASREDGSPAKAPLLSVGSQRLEGYDEAAWDTALDKAGYPGGKAPAPRPPAAEEEKQP